MLFCWPAKKGEKQGPGVVSTLSSHELMAGWPLAFQAMYSAWRCLDNPIHKNSLILTVPSLHLGTEMSNSCPQRGCVVAPNPGWCVWTATAPSCSPQGRSQALTWESWVLNSWAKDSRRDELVKQKVCWMLAAMLPPVAPGCARYRDKSWHSRALRLPAVECWGCLWKNSKHSGGL